MHIDKGVMRTEAIFSDNREHRYLLKKEWDVKKPKATIIMTNPSTASLWTLDYTTLYILNNLVKLDFGSVDIVNMMSKTTTKLNLKEDINAHVNEENIQQILKSAERADKVIIAWGKLGDSNKKIKAIQDSLLDRLKPYHDKLCIIASETGEFGFHPLAPQIRFFWHLAKFEMPEKQEDKTEPNKQESGQDQQLQRTEQTA